MAGRFSKTIFIPAVLSALLVFSASAAAAIPSITTNVSAFTEWLPIIILAIMVSVVIVLIYYIIGKLLNNKSIVSAAIFEFENAIGTAVIVVIILVLFEFFGSGVYPTLLMSNTAATNICTTLNGANVNFINTLQQNPTNQICTKILPNVGNSSGSSAGNQSAQQTNNLDYGLASTYLVVANLTNQTATNLNAYYMFRSYMSFLSSFNSSDIICWPQQSCLESGFGVFEAKYTFQPFGGYEILLGSANLLTQQSTLIFYFFIIQLITITVLLYAWPYILAAGIILRASFLTRRVGGLLIAIAVVGLLVYPAIFLMQYNSLNNLSGSSPIGAASVPNLQLIGKTPTGTINYDTRLNFYVFPRADYIIANSGCWPPGGNLIAGELQVIGAYGSPGLGLINGALNLLSTASSSLGGPQLNSQLLSLGFGCRSPNAIQTVFALYNLYGIMSIIGVIFPILNVLITISALISVSSILGGDTRLFGLERLV